MKMYKMQRCMRWKTLQLQGSAFVHSSTIKACLSCDISPYFCEMITKNYQKKKNSALNLKTPEYRKWGRVQWIGMDQTVSTDSAEQILAET